MTRLGAKRYHLWNIGCQMNRADAYRVAEVLEKHGYTPTRQPEHADIIVLNTCVVRQSAEDKVVGRLSSLATLKRRASRDVVPSSGIGCEPAILVMGCFVDDIAALELRFPHVDAFFRPSDIEELTRFVQQRDASFADAPTGPSVTPPQVADLVPISYGCDHRCTYCIVALRRGRQRSRPIPEIVADVHSLVQRGTREITLLGQNVDAYGSDLPGHADLADILQAIHDIPDLWRIRFLTSHPKDMTERIIDAVATLPKVCECWELPIQSGDDEVLRRMGRGYTAEHFRNLVHDIRRRLPSSAINTDVIVGFPGETAAQFERTLDLVRDVRFDMVHVAAYSVRPGTTAARWEDDVPTEEKERRRALIERTQEQIAAESNAILLGHDVEVLVDGQQRGRWRGRTRSNKLVFFEDSHTADGRSPNAGNWLGRLALVHIAWTGPWSMLGEVHPAATAAQSSSLPV